MARKHPYLAVTLALFLSAIFVVPARAQDGKQQFADLGECSLASGELIKECRIGYRTWGTLNADKSNAVVVLLPYWEEGDTSSAASTWEARWPDSAQHFVVVIDTIGNEVSIGPNNSKSQPGAKFPQFTMRDLVEIDRRVLKEALGVDRPYAVIGEHFGGMQALEWMVAYPDEMKKVVAIATTPKPTAWDLAGWQAHVDILSRPRQTKDDDIDAAMAAGSVNLLMLAGPLSRMEAMVKESAMGSITGLRLMQDWPLWYGLDRLKLYANAIVKHDIYRDFGGSMQKAADAAKADLLVMVLPDDHLTPPEPMLALAEEMDAGVVELSAHQSPSWLAWHDNALISKEVRAFLAQ